jgi:hypothetical protein
VSDALTNEVDIASRREFILYWAGFVILIVGAVSILMTISGLMVDVLSYRCWYPIVSPMLGVNEPPKPTQVTDMPYHCTNPAVAVVRFVFNLFAGLIVIGAGGYMMLNGKKR